MKVTESRTIQGSPDRLFHLAQDYSRRRVWDTSLADVRLIDCERPGIGALVFYRGKDGSRMLARYIAFSPPQVAAVSMVRGPWWVKEFSGSWTFRCQTDGSTVVTFSYGFRLRPRLFEWMLGTLIRVATALRARRALARLATLAEQLP